MVFPLDLKIKIENIHCQVSDENNGAEPYLWVVYFKIDGDTAWVDATKPYLQGTATVVSTPGNHGNLGVSHAHSGDDIKVPAAIGEWNTVLKPIPLNIPGATALDNLDAAAGFVVVLMEEDSTNDHILSRAHDALNGAVQRALDGLLSRLTMSHPRPGAEEVSALIAQVGSEVKAAIKDEASLWDWLGGAGDMDDRIGVDVHQYTAQQLETNAQGGIVGGVSLGGIGFRSYWPNEGEWDLTGHIYGNPIVEFIPLVPNVLTPVRGGSGSSWDGTWHGTLPDRAVPAIVLDIVPSSPAGHTVDARETIFHPPATAHMTNVEPSGGIVSSYTTDIWTFPQTEAPAHSQLVRAQQANASNAAMAVHAPRAAPVAAQANPLTSSAILAHRVGEPAAAELTTQSGSSAPSHPSSPRGNAGVAHNPLIDQLQISKNLVLSLYAEVGAHGAIDAYRIRYQRSRDDGAIIEDVMLNRYTAVH